MSARIDDGHQTLISFAADTDVLFWEIEVKPPGVDGGGAIDTTVMDNATWRTASPKSLKTLTNGSLTVAYDPACYPEIIALINVNTQITITFPDADTLVFWGWLNKFEPAALKEGERPTAEIEILPSNTNASVAETAPVHSTTP